MVPHLNTKAGEQCAIIRKIRCAAIVDNKRHGFEKKLGPVLLQQHVAAARIIWECGFDWNCIANW